MVQINDNNNLINLNTTPLAYAFYTIAIKIYRHKNDFPPPPKSWKEIFNYKYIIKFKAATYTKIKVLTRKHT